MKVAIALIYDKAVKPSFFIVEMSLDDWRKILHGNQRVRQRYDCTESCTWCGREGEGTCLDSIRQSK